MLESLIRELIMVGVWAILWLVCIGIVVTAAAFTGVWLWLA